MVASAIAKANKYSDLPTYAQSARVFDPRQQANLPKDIVQYVQTDKTQRVIPEKMQSELGSEWELYWPLFPVKGDMDLIGWWKGVQGQLLKLAWIAIRTLSIPHSAAGVERCNSYYKLTRSENKTHSKSITIWDISVLS